jgi:biotin synthase
MSEETQALCFLAGANSIFYGDKLLTTDNPDQNADRELFERLGIRAEALRNAEPHAEAACALKVAS